VPFSTREAAFATLRQNRVAAAVVAIVLFATPVFNWYYAARLGDQLHALRGGLCKIIVKSNALAQENRAALLTTAARAAHRARLDAADGHNQLAQADRDAARLDQKFADEITPTILEGCPTP